MDKGKNEVLLEELPVILEELFKIIYKIIDDTDDVEEIIKNEAVKDVDLTELIQITDQQIAEYINEKICDKEKNDLVFKVFQKLKINQSIEEITDEVENEEKEQRKRAVLALFDKILEPDEIEITDKDVCIKYNFGENSKLKNKIDEIDKWNRDNVVETVSRELKVPIDNIILVDNVSSYIDFISNFDENNYVSRGQKDCKFKLEPSLHRIYNDSFQLHSSQYESAFKQRILYYDETTEKKNAEELRAYGQHYGLPTNYSYIISRHHSDMNNLEYFFSGLTGKNTEGDNSGKDAYDWYEMFKQELYKEPVVKLRKRDEWLNRMAYQSNEKNIYLYAWTRLLYSLLVAADYYATSEFMNGYENNDYGNVNNIDNIINEYENNDVQKSIRNYEKNIKRLDEEQLAKVNKDTVIGNIKGINVLRTEMFLETEYNLKNNIDSKIFYLEAPTGSGKSNTAFNLSFQLLKKSDYCKKIFYVYPFNTLVEQNMNSMEKIFGQKEDIMSNIAVVNSITPYKVKNSLNINLYKNEKYAIEDYQKILLDRQFLNYPIVLSTHITLFDTMFGRSKGSTFGFHQLCHSVIVLDEIQSYNNNKWGAMINFLKAYAQLLDIKIIIMSATLPNLELLTNNNAKAVRLINNREKYFNHRMFANRVKVNYELLNRKIGIAELEEHILQHKNKRILIEFIRKSSAEEFYAYISESAECPVRLITGDSSIQERKDIIADIENMQEVILVATQVIEAGVDIDMDIGYKDISRLDSEEQFIGRINRSCRKDGVVYFFNMDDAKGIYRKDVRVDTDNTLMNEEIRQVLNSKDFYDYYEKYVIPVLKNAQGQCNDNNIDEFIRKEVGKLDFNKVADKMKLIDDNRQMYSIYFSRNIIDKNNPENVIDGKKIWKEYKELLQDNHMSYQEKTVKLHNIRSKMNMFMYQFKIELYNENHKPVIENLEWDEQIGDIFYVENGEDYYDENGVLNKELFKDNEDLFI